MAGWLGPEYARIQGKIRSADVVYVDETGAKVDGVLHWVWVFTTRSDTLNVVRKSRGKRVPTEVLGEGFKGVIVCDGWRAYPRYTGRIQRCWAHLLREARYLAERNDEARASMERLAGKPYESVEVRRFAAKIMNGMGHWFTFLTVPGVEATNNRAERALREFVVQRKIMGCFRNGKGTGIYETMMTVLATWKQQGRDLPQTLAEALTQEWNKS